MDSDILQGAQGMDREELMKFVETAQAAHKAQSTANDLRSKASALSDPAKREQMLQEAYAKEVEANGHSKMAKRLQSGTWQGLGFGGGIGAAGSLGLGAGVGTVLGAVLAVPATGLGMLIGSGVGAIHGPWVKLGGKEQKFEDADAGEIVDELEKERNSNGSMEPEQMAAVTMEGSAHNTNVPTDQPRRKPKKLEIRSQRSSDASNQPRTADSADSATRTTGTTSQQVRKKPKKLEIRSGKSS